MESKLANGRILANPEEAQANAAVKQSQWNLIVIFFPNIKE